MQTKRVVSTALCALILTGLSFAASPDRISAAIDSSRTVQLRKTQHPKALPQYDRGPVDPAFKLSYITLMTSPSPAQQKALDKLVAAQQDPASPYYHLWLTPSQYADQFGLSQNDIKGITGWLKAYGFVVQSVGGGRNTVIFGGTAAQIKNAFGVEIHRYEVNGEVHYANATPVMIPAALNGIVSGIRGLHDFRMHTASQMRPAVRSRLRANYYDGSYIFPNFLAPGDIATIYDINKLYTASTPIDGTGETIAVVGRTDIFLSDINDFRSGFNLPTIIQSNCTTNPTTGVITACNDPHFKYVLVLPTGGTDPGVPDSVAQGDITEADLDVEWSGAVAYNAQVIYVNAPDTDVSDSLSAAINPPSGPPLATVITLSYGICEVAAVDAETELQQAAAEGVTVVNSSGDSGAAGCDNQPPNSNQPFSPAVGGLAVNYPASSPWVVAVGGTAITLANDSYPNPSSYWGTTNGTTGGTATTTGMPETPWNDDEELAAYCHSPVNGDTFCSSGGGTPGWVSLTTSATSQQVQQDVWISAGGGGASNCFTESAQGVCTAGFSQPTWQQGLAITTPNTSGVRWVPDISLFASPNFPGYIFCTPLNPDGTPPDYTSTCSSGIFTAVDTNQSLIGGTSVAAPVFAGMLALLNQSLAGPSSPGLGDIHSTLYALAKTPSNKAFNKIAGGDNMTYCTVGQPLTTPPQPSTIVCPQAGVFGYSSSGTGNFDPTTGYNLVTGLGSVDLDNLAKAWNGSRGVSTTTITPSSTNIGLGNSVTFTATVTPSAGIATPTGNVSFFNNGSSTALGTTTLSSGVATFATTSLPAGTNSVTATYAGDGNNASSSSSTPAIVDVGGFSLNSPSATVVAGHATGAITITLTPISGFNQLVTFSCGSSVPAGVTGCTFNPTTVTPDGVHPISTSLTISTAPSMATGSTPVNVSATGGGVTITSTVSLTVNPTDQSFALALSPPNQTISVAQGSQVQVTVNLTGTNGFNTPVQYSCSDPASESVCTGPSGYITSSTAANFTITATAPVTQLHKPFGHGSGIFYAALLPGLLGIIFTVGSRKRASLRGMRLLGLIVVLGVSTLWLGACSGSTSNANKNPGTPVGPYTITITATTGGAVPVTNNPPLTFTVNVVQ